MYLFDSFRERIKSPWMLLGILITGILLLLYGRTLWNEFVLWDDDYLILENPLIRSLSPQTLATAFSSYDPELYIPLTFVSYQLNYLVGGLHPFSYHLVNLVLHGLNALLTGGIAYFLSKKDLRIAAAVALLFAVHPIHTEAVAWASARKDVLAAAFFLVSLLGFLRYRDAGERRWYMGSVVAFAFALFSKVSVIGLPLILLLVDYRDRRVWNLKRTQEYMPYVLLSVVFGIVALFGKTAQIEHSTLLETLLLTAKSIVFYLEKIILPLHLSPLYPFTGVVSATSPGFFVPVLLVLAITILCLWQSRVHRDGVFAWFFFLIMLAPSMVNFRKGEEGDIYLASDRYAYLASFGVLFLLVSLAYRSRWIRTAYATYGVAIIAVILCILSYTQAGIWRNSETLFRSVIQKYPNAQAAHHNLGVLEQKNGRPQEALVQYQAALLIAPKASTESNIGDIFRENGQPAEALTHYQNALALSPQSVDAQLGLGLLYMQNGDVQSAIPTFQSAVAANPQDARTHLNLGAALTSVQRIDEAIAEYQKAIALDPLSAAGYFNLAVAYERVGRNEEAATAYRRAVEIDPSFAPVAQEALKRLPTR